MLKEILFNKSITTNLFEFIGSSHSRFYLNEFNFRLYLDFREFITSLSLTSRGTPDEKLCWAFNMYDINGDGRISINEVIDIVKSVQELLKLDSDHYTHEQIEKTFWACDQNKDGRLTIEEFIKGSKSNPVLMKVVSDYIK